VTGLVIDFTPDAFGCAAKLYLIAPGAI